MNEHRRPSSPERACGDRVPGPQHPYPAQSPRAPPPAPLEARAHRCARRIPSSASPWSSMPGTLLDLWQGARAKELGGPGWRAGPPAPGASEPETGGARSVVTLRGRPSGERDLCFSNQKKVSNGGFPAFWEVHPEKALLEMTHPGRSCWLALEISSGNAGDPDGGGSGDYALTHFDADSGNNHHLKYQLLVRKCSPPRGQPSLPPQLHPWQSALLISPIPFLLTPASCRIGPA